MDHTLLSAVCGMLQTHRQRALASELFSMVKRLESLCSISLPEIKKETMGFVLKCLVGLERWLSSVPALLEDPVSVPSTHLVARNHL